LLQPLRLNTGEAPLNSPTTLPTLPALLMTTTMLRLPFIRGLPATENALLINLMALADIKARLKIYSMIAQHLITHVQGITE